MIRKRWQALAGSLIATYLSAQTQVDLRTQSKGVDFQGAAYTRPLKSTATLPATCTVNEVLLLTSAPAGSNIYVCLSANNWVPEASGSGTVTIQNGGSPVGAEGTQNFIAGAGLINAVTDLGTRINIQQGIDTSLVLTRGGLQSGQSLLCSSASGSGTAYTCSMTPTLTAYSSGMILYWKPDVNGTGGATTLNVDILGAVPLMKADGITSPGALDIVAGQLYPVWYDGASMRLLSSAAAAASSGGGTVSSNITSTSAGGGTVLTAASEWHSPVAFCSGPAAAALVWNTPPLPGVAAAAAGCTGANVNDAYAAFANTGTPSLQTSFTLPQTLTGTADVYVTYLSSVSGGTFTPALDVVCTRTDASSYNDPVFTANNFFAPGSLTGPAIANALGTASAYGLTWPAGCTAGARAHLRLIRTDTAGTAVNLNIAEVVLVLRRTL